MPSCAILKVDDFSLLQSFLLGFIITSVPGTVFLETIRRAMVSRKSVAIFLMGNVVGVTVTVTIVL
jgi:threonine/homoserine/homoserine lactone efflux protein